MSHAESNHNSNESPQEPRLEGIAYGPDGNLLPQHVSAVHRYRYKLPEFIIGSIEQYTKPAPESQPDTES